MLFISIFYNFCFVFIVFLEIPVSSLILLGIIVICISVISLLLNYDVKHMHLKSAI